MKIRTLGAVLCLLVAATGFAAGNPQLQPIAGNWTCTGIAFASDMGPEHPTKANVAAVWTLNDQWLQVRYVEVKTAKNPKPISATLLMSYNAAQKKVVSGCVDSMGGYCTEDSPGWEGDKLVLNGSGVFGADTMKVRDTFTKGPGWIKHLGEMETPKGWMKMNEETCKK